MLSNGFASAKRFPAVTARFLVLAACVVTLSACGMSVGGDAGGGSGGDGTDSAPTVHYWTEPQSFWWMEPVDRDPSDPIPWVYVNYGQVDGAGKIMASWTTPATAEQSSQYWLNRFDGD